MSKKRAMITVDTDQWERLQAELKEQGFPTGSMSYYIAACLQDLEERLCEGSNMSSCNPYFELMVHRDGLRKALESTGFKIIEEDSEPE